MSCNVCNHAMRKRLRLQRRFFCNMYCKNSLSSQLATYREIVRKWLKLQKKLDNLFRVIFVMFLFAIFVCFHLQTQIQAVPVLSFLYPSLISFSSTTFPGTPYRIFLRFLPWLPCHFYLVVIEQKQRGGGAL